MFSSFESILCLQIQCYWDVIYHISVQSESDIPLPWQYPVITQRATCPIQCTVYLSHPRDISNLHVWIHPAGPLYLQIPTPSHHFQGKGTLRCTHFPYRCVVITNIALSSCVTMITSSGTLTLEKSDPTQGWTCKDNPSHLSVCDIQHYFNPLPVPQVSRCGHPLSKRSKALYYHAFVLSFLLCLQSI